MEIEKILRFDGKNWIEQKGFWKWFYTYFHQFL